MTPKEQADDSRLAGLYRVHLTWLDPTKLQAFIKSYETNGQLVEPYLSEARGIKGAPK
jgi:hypothetical protein